MIRYYGKDYADVWDVVLNCPPSTGELIMLGLLGVWVIVFIFLQSYSRRLIWAARQARSHEDLLRLSGNEQ